MKTCAKAMCLGSFVFLGQLIGTQAQASKELRVASSSDLSVTASVGSLSIVDKLHRVNTRNKALVVAPKNSRMEWVNPHSGHSGVVIMFDELHARCREFKEIFFVGGRSIEQDGVGCRGRAGWQVITK